jgi:hypothetical protein
MNFEINISKNGKHFFATAKRSCTDSIKAYEVLKELAARFPDSEGYAITLTKYSTSGRTLDVENFLNPEYDIVDCEMRNRYVRALNADTIVDDER